MTQLEIAQILGYKDTAIVCKGFKQASEIMPTLLTKTRRGACYELNYTWEETKCALECLGLSPITIELIRDNFIDRPVKYVYHEKNPYIPGTEEFLKKYERNPKRCRCCSTCIFLQARSIAHETSRLHPYCIFYGKFTRSIKVERRHKKTPANIFVDRCPSYQKAVKPLLFRRKI